MILKYYFKYAPLFIICHFAFCIYVSFVDMLTGPYTIRYLFNGLSEGKSFEELFTFLLIVSVAFFLRLASKYEIAYLPRKLIIKRAAAQNSLSAGIKHIESIRLGILEKLSGRTELSPPQRACLDEELDRKRGIVKSR